MSQLYNKYAARLASYAFGICGDMELSKDIVQDVFVEYLKNPPQKEIASWFYRVCKNKLINRLVRENRKQSCTDDFFAGIESGTATPAQKAEREDAFANLQRHLACLNRDEREAINLRYFEEFSYAKIAEIMGTTPSNVGTLIFRGLAKLRDRMTKKSAQ